MSERKSYDPGTFCWIDLATSDPEAAKAFYAELFGWTYEDMPAGPGVYTIARRKGLDVAGLFEMAEGDPMPHWNSYVLVDDVAEAAGKAKDLGASILVEPSDAEDAGRMAVAADPAGAVFCLWQARNHIGARLVNEEGALVWNELATSDAEKATAFYGGLFGWAANVQSMDSGDTYTTFMDGDTPRAGMMQMDERWEGIPPHWMVYLAVDDCAATVAKLKSLGGQAHVEPTEIPSVGTFAVVQDPQGAVFSVIKMKATPG